MIHMEKTAKPRALAAVLVYPPLRVTASAASPRGVEMRGVIQAWPVATMSTPTTRPMTVYAPNARVRAM